LSNSGNTIIGEGTGDGPGPTYTIVEDPVEGPPPAFQPVEREPQIIHSAVPEYPPLAVKANIQGRVVVRVWVDKQGRPREVHIWSSTDEILNDAALEAAKKYLFVPAYMNAGPVSVWVSLAFNFRLK
jgi:periplasmic protein TonB